MFGRFMQQWKDATRARPGERFQNRYYRRENRRATRLMKTLKLAIGTALVVVGAILLPAPGPGFLVIFIGATMIAEESLLVAKALDGAELEARRLASSAKRVWRHASAALKALIVTCGAVFTAGACWAAYAVLLN
jgi:uncharacterized protein (TIGR02611 family)